MAVIIQCPHCRSELAIDQAPSGTEFECPVCRKNFTVETGTPDGTDEKKHRQQDSLRRQLVSKIAKEAENWVFPEKSIQELQQMLSKLDKNANEPELAEIRPQFIQRVYDYAVSLETENPDLAEACLSCLPDIPEAVELRNAILARMSRKSASNRVRQGESTWELSTPAKRKLIDFKSKTFWFFAFAAILLLCLLGTFFFLSNQKARKEIAEKKNNEINERVKAELKRLKSAEDDFCNVRAEYDDTADMLNERIRWPELINEVQAVLPNDVWLTKLELTRSARNTQHSQDYVSVFMTGHGRVKNQNFAENFTWRLSSSKYFVFNKATDTIDKLQNGVLQNGEYNIATFELTLKMKNAIKQ